MSEPETAIASRVSVVLVDDHEIWRGGVKSMLEDTEFHVIAEASSGREGVKVVADFKPDLVMLDIRMSGGDGLEALSEIKSKLPTSTVVMLTTYDNPTYMARAVAFGAAGYLLKGIHRDELLTSLRAVVSGELLLSRQDLAHALRGVTRETIGSNELFQPLTEREEEVLRHLATGLSNKEIGSLLYVAESTIKTHVEHIICKLGVSDRVQAAVWAARHGIAEITPPGM